MLSEKTKRIVLTGVATILIAGSTAFPVFADVVTNQSGTVGIERNIQMEEVQYPSFENFMKNDVKKKNISEDDMKELKKLYYEAVDYKKEGKFKEANRTMKELQEIANKYEDIYKNNYVKPININSIKKQIKYPSFQDFMKNDIKKKAVSEDDMKELEKIYHKAVDYKKEGKFKEANRVMNEFHEIANEYEDLYKNNYVKPINIQISYPSFEDFMINDVKKRDVSEDDMEELENLYEGAVDYKKEGKFKEANRVMNEFYQLVDEYDDIINDDVNN